MSATLNDATVIKHEDLISGCDGAQPVCHRNRGPPTHRALKRLLHVSLGYGVKRRRCLVEQEDWRIFQEYARNSETLTLSTGERSSPLL